MTVINIIKGEAEQTDIPGLKIYKSILNVDDITQPATIHIKTVSPEYSEKLANFIKEKLKEFYKKQSF